MSETRIQLEYLMALAWAGAGFAMVIHIAGRTLVGWTTDHASWWVALALLAATFAAETYTYIGGVEGDG